MDDTLVPKLAALLYYGSDLAEKGVSFETLDEEKRKPYLVLAVTALMALDKLNLVIVPKGKPTGEEADKILHDRIEATIRDFFAGIKVWKKGLIPQEEIVARIWQVLKT